MQSEFLILTNLHATCSSGGRGKDKTLIVMDGMEGCQDTFYIHALLHIHPMLETVVLVSGESPIHSRYRKKPYLGPGLDSGSEAHT